MIDDLTILAILPLVVVIVFGLRWTKPVGAVRVPVVPEPLRIYHQPEPLPEPVHVFETPEPVAYTDETIQFPEGMLAFLQSLPDIGPGGK